MPDINIIENPDNYYWDRLPDAKITRERPHLEHPDIILQFTELDNGKETIKGVIYPKRYTIEEVKAMANKHEPEIQAGECKACNENTPDIQYRDFFPVIQRPSAIGFLRNAVRSRLETRLSR